MVCLRLLLFSLLCFAFGLFSLCLVMFVGGLIRVKLVCLLLVLFALFGFYWFCFCLFRFF